MAVIGDSIARVTIWHSPLINLFILHPDECADCDLSDPGPTGSPAHVFCYSAAQVMQSSSYTAEIRTEALRVQEKMTGSALWPTATCKIKT